MQTLYALHSEYMLAEARGQTHYAAALRVMLERQAGDLRPDLGRGATLTLAEPETPVKAKETVLACPRCTSTETARHRGDCVQYKWCLDCGLKWDFC